MTGVEALRRPEKAAFVGSCLNRDQALQNYSPMASAVLYVRQKELINSQRQGFSKSKGLSVSFTSQ